MPAAMIRTTLRISTTGQPQLLFPPFQQPDRNFRCALIVTRRPALENAVHLLFEKSQLRQKEAGAYRGCL